MASGATLEETSALIGRALELHIEAMREDGDPVPDPTTRVDYVALAS